ncbi:MAG: hypothetical protein KY476_24200 [Planctomycetes bacterium]|nr:hypothetical protein [Planctomycetota bacterium]
MKPRLLIEIAALAAAGAEEALANSSDALAAAARDFWQHSRRLHAQWLRELAAAEKSRDAEGLIREVLTAELLTRLWAAMTAAADESSGMGLASLGRHVFHSHLEARRRCLELLIRLPHAAAQPLDVLRRRAERWCDVLVGGLVRRYGVDEFAFDPRRAVDFARDQRRVDAGSGPDTMWTLVLAGLRLSFPDSLPPLADSAELSAIAACTVKTFGQCSEGRQPFAAIVREAARPERIRFRTLRRP